MKNKISQILIIIFIFFLPMKTLSDETFSYEADKIKILNSGKTIVGEKL